MRVRLRNMNSSALPEITSRRLWGECLYAALAFAAVLTVGVVSRHLKPAEARYPDVRARSATCSDACACGAGAPASHSEVPAIREQVGQQKEVARAAHQKDLK